MPPRCFFCAVRPTQPLRGTTMPVTSWSIPKYWHVLNGSVGHSTFDNTPGGATAELHPWGLHRDSWPDAWTLELQMEGKFKIHTQRNLREKKSEFTQKPLMSSAVDFFCPTSSPLSLFRILQRCGLVGPPGVPNEGPYTMPIVAT